MAIDAEVLAVKTFDHFTSSAKGTAALKLAFTYIGNGEEYFYITCPRAE
jgi:hypothetical protein